MGKKYRIYQVDSFTRKKFAGNPAGVVLDADGLSEAQMQAIARELNNSETAFVLAPEADDHDVRIRFFTPLTEVPSCGHATIAAHYVRAVEYALPSSRLKQKTGIGILPVELVKVGHNYSIHMTQGPVEFCKVLDSAELTDVLAALGLTSADLDNRGAVQIVSTGHGKVLVPLKSRNKLDSLQPDFPALQQLSQKLGCNGYFPFTLDSNESGILTFSRMFAPAIGIAEDPVTGNGNGPLAAYLIRYKMVDFDGNRFKFKGKQGVAMGRPGVAHVSVDVEDSKPTCVRVGGQAVILFKTEIII